MLKFWFKEEDVTEFFVTNALFFRSTFTAKLERVSSPKRPSNYSWNLKTRKFVFSGLANSTKLGRVIRLSKVWWLRIVVIAIGFMSSRSSACAYSGLRKDAEAPVTIKNFSGCPKGDDMLIYGRIERWLLISTYLEESLRLFVENLGHKFRSLGLTQSVGWNICPLA